MSNQGSATHHIVSHDPATYQPPAQDVPKYIPTRRKKPLLVLATAGLLLITAGLVLLYLNKDRLLNQGDQQPTTTSYVPDQTVLFSVGVEKIFAEDLNYELSFYPEEQRESLKDSLKQRLAHDSVILQAGAEEGYIQLDDSVFNSVLKDRAKRQELVQKVTEAVNSEASSKTGAIVSVWFMNIEPGPIGYDEGKKLAFEKINTVYQAVKSGSMTIKQAGETLKKDTQLAQVDPSYKENAYVEFDTKKTPELTFDQGFNSQLTKLDQGEITSLYLAKDHPLDEETEPLKDAVYIFGQVTSVSAGVGPNFEDWLTQQRENYAVTEE